MNILYELYNGNIAPSEKYIKRNGEYRKLLEELTRRTDILISTMDRDTQKLWEEISDIDSAMEVISDRESFVDGFCIGARIIFEIMVEDRTNRTVL